MGKVQEAGVLGDDETVVQKAIERKAEARRQASAKAIATKKAKAEMIAQAHKDEAERAIKIEQLKAKQIADAKKLALAEAEAKKAEIIKQCTALKKSENYHQVKYDHM